jgi:hypothetical protein
MYRNEGTMQPTLEYLITRRLEKTFEAMDASNGQLFDEIIEGIEMLFQLKPSAKQELEQYKEEIIEKAVQAIEEARQIAEYSSNEIKKNNFLQGEVYSIEWDMRKEYLEKIVTVIGKYQMIPFERPSLAEIESEEEEEEEEEEDEEVVEEVVVKKPKISKSVREKKIKKKVVDNDDEGFLV